MLSHQTSIEYQCQVNLNIYDSPICERLATQAAAGRHLRILSHPQDVETQVTSLHVCLCEDDYQGWLLASDLEKLITATTPYQAIALSEAEIKQRLGGVIAFTHAAMKQPNYYLWGGTVEPNYDCSGLMQAAFASVGIWLPRDSYQQEAFTQPIAIVETRDLTSLQLGDLIFFGTAQKVTHVALYLGEERYIHSSGREIGRNGIGIDRLSEREGTISQAYYQQLRGAGRVVQSYQPRLLTEVGNKEQGIGNRD